jgi:hypothetical protein
MGIALDAGNNLYQELWKDGRNLPTPTPYPALTEMNPVGSIKKVNVFTSCVLYHRTLPH